MSDTLRLIDGEWLEMDHQRVARLLPGLSPSLIDRLNEALEAADEDADYIVHLENQIDDLEDQIADFEKQLAEARK